MTAALFLAQCLGTAIFNSLPFHAKMPKLNVNLPQFYCFLRMEFLYDGQAHHGEFIRVCVFGAASIAGRALGFHVLTETGATIWRLPLHAFCHKSDAPPRPLDLLEFWDCFSYDIAVTKFDRLRDARVRVQLKNGEWMSGQYLFTIDWYGNEVAEQAGDGGHKCAHVIALDDGNFCAQPNNRLQWFDPAFVTPFEDKPDYLTNTRCWRVEREQETTGGYFYDSSTKENEQVQLYAKGMRVEKYPQSKSDECINEGESGQ